MVLPKYKDIVDLIKKGSTLEAQERILELREAALELQEENLELREVNAKLQKRLATNESLKFESGLYWLLENDNRGGPFCPKCKDTKDQMVRMHKDDDGWWCYTCNHGFGTTSYT
ncbi:hypothetical protein H5123_19150 [Shewanella sp. SR43-4]|uniref:hypothetical protein n=1 Tax=Shewanella sp. SR43-4 TaxID=2760942 RepID=UPI0015F8BE50|nr:hypothetical protein [Shewanella sp. SR43-4]MBB1319745.1 hypothetical protein [Shewanella sp. SR43-4]